MVTENYGHCVFVCGMKLQSFGTQGSGHRQFKYPRGVVVDSEGNILVADTIITFRNLQQLVSSSQQLVLKVVVLYSFICLQMLHSMLQTASCI